MYTELLHSRSKTVFLDIPSLIHKILSENTRPNNSCNHGITRTQKYMYLIREKIEVDNLLNIKLQSYHKK